MTTPYERPQQKITQNFASGSVNTFTPTLNACMVGPVYEMVEDEASGTYISEEKEFDFLSANSVDLRLTDDNEVLYPVTLTFTDAQILYDDAQSGVLTAYQFVDNKAAPNDHPFDFALVTGERAYLRFVAGSYRHTFPTLQGTVTLTNPGGATTYRLTSTIPVFYPEDYDTAGAGTVPTTIDYLDAAGAARAGKTVTAIDSTNYLWIEFTDTAQVPGPGPGLVGLLAALTQTDRATLLASELLAKRVRTITDVDTVQLYTARDYAVYTISDYDILRQLDLSYNITQLTALGVAFTATGFTLPALMEDEDGSVIESATVTATYRALRGDKFEDLLEYANATDLAADFTVSEYNTAVWMVKCALDESNGRPVLLSPVGTEYYYTNPLQAYTDVFTFLQGQETPYGIVPATFATSVVTALDTHVNASSAEDVANFRRGYVSHKLVTSTNMITAATTASAYVDGILEGFSDRYLRDAAFVSPSVGYVTDLVEAGHYVKITNWTAVVPTLTATLSQAGPPNIAALTDVVGWATANTKLVISDVNADPGITSGMTVKFTTPTHDQTADTCIYTDQTRGGVAITTSQTYAALGYRVISANYTGTTLTLYLYTLGAIAVAPVVEAVSAMTFYDGPLSLREETAILNQNILISEVNSENKLTAVFKSGWTGIYSGLRYDIVDAYTKDEQAENYAAYAESLSERRMTIIYPDYYEDENGVTMPAYFMCAARAGWRSGHPAHEPMTNTYLSGFYKLLRTDIDKYFRDTQLDKMAAGGVEIYLQTVAGAGIKCRHQLTTDRSSILKQEETSTCAVDTACKMLKGVIKPLIGRYNIGPDLFSVLNTRIAGVRDLVTDRPIANFGSILKSFEISTLAQDPDNADGLILEIDSVTQKPFNRIHTTMRIS